MRKTGKIFFILTILYLFITTNSSSFNYENNKILKYEKFNQSIKNLSVNNKNKFSYMLKRSKQCISENKDEKAQNYLLLLELLYIKIENEIYILQKEKKTASDALTQLSQIITINIETLKKFNVYEDIVRSYKSAKDDIEKLSIFQAKTTIRKAMEKIQKLTDKEQE